MENPTKATPLIKCLSPYIRVVAHWKHLLLVIDENDHFFQINTQKDFYLEPIEITRKEEVAYTRLPLRIIVHNGKEIGVMVDSDDRFSLITRQRESSEQHILIIELCSYMSGKMSLYPNPIVSNDRIMKCKDFMSDFRTYLHDCLDANDGQFSPTANAIRIAQMIVVYGILRHISEIPEYQIKDEIVTLTWPRCGGTDIYLAVDGKYEQFIYQDELNIEEKYETPWTLDAYLRTIDIIVNHIEKAGGPSPSLWKQ